MRSSITKTFTKTTLFYWSLTKMTFVKTMLLFINFVNNSEYFIIRQKKSKYPLYFQNRSQWSILWIFLMDKNARFREEGIFLFIIFTKILNVAFVFYPHSVRPLNLNQWQWHNSRTKQSKIKLKRFNTNEWWIDST